MTESSLKRVLDFTDSITFDIKAFNPNLFSALTGADVEPVLRNAEYIVRHAQEKLWEFRILLIPHLHEQDLLGLCEYIAGLGAKVPINFLAFRPNFIMSAHPWTADEFMEAAVKIAHKAGLENVSWSGRTKSSTDSSTTEDRIPENVQDHVKTTKLPSNTALTIGYAHANGCIQKRKRQCGNCTAVNECSIKRYTTDSFQ
jgi:hypothetical protein